MQELGLANIQNAVMQRKLDASEEFSKDFDQEFEIFRESQLRDDELSQAEFDTNLAASRESIELLKMLNETLTQETAELKKLSLRYEAQHKLVIQEQETEIELEKELNAINMNLDCQNLEAEKAFRQFQQDRTGIAEEVSNCKKRNADLEQDLESLNNTYERTLSERTHYRDTVEKRLGQLREELKFLDNQSEEIDTQHNGVQNQLTSARVELEVKSNEYTVLEKQCAQLQESFNKLQAEAIILDVRQSDLLTKQYERRKETEVKTVELVTVQDRLFQVLAQY